MTVLVAVCAAMTFAVASSSSATNVATAKASAFTLPLCNSDRLETPFAAYNRYVLLYSGTPVRSGYSTTCSVRQTVSGTPNFRLYCWLKNKSGQYWFYGQAMTKGGKRGWVRQSRMFASTVPAKTARTHC